MVVPNTFRQLFKDELKLISLQNKGGKISLKKAIIIDTKL